MIVTQPDRVLLKRDIAALAPLLTGKVLDIGGGEGTRYRDYCKNAGTYLVLEAYESFKPDIIGSAEAIPLEDASIDNALCTQVLEHVPHPALALREAFRVLKPGGKLILTAPQWNELHEEPHDYYRYTKFGLTVLCEEAGFKILEMRQRGKYHACIAQVRIRHWIDTWRPYQNKWSMKILGPLTLLYTRYALWRDARSTSPVSAKHAIGWAVLLEKPL